MVAMAPYRQEEDWLVLHTAGLSERELDVLVRLAQGHSNKEIAKDLVLSLWTVNNHVRSVFEKLKVDDRTQAAMKALDLGLLKRP